MDPQQLLGFAAVSITLAMTPGADWAYAISAGLRQGRIAPAIAGLCAGYLVHTAFIVAGLAALIAARPELLTVLTVLGAAYLLWLGITTIRSWRSAGFTAGSDPADLPVVPDAVPSGSVALSPSVVVPSAGVAGAAAVPPAADAGPALLTVPRETESVDSTPVPEYAASDRRAFFKGLGTSGTNPKALLLYLALIPQFIAPGAAWPVPLQSTVLGLSHLMVSAVLYTCVALGARRLLRSRPGAARLVTLGSGVIMVLLAVGLVGEQAAALF